MFSTALNGLLLALLTLLPLAKGSPSSNDDPKNRDIVEDRVVVLPEGDIEVDADGDDPIVVRVGRGGGFLGVRLIAITDALRSHYGAPKDAGVLVAEVEEGSPAARAGIEVGDVITGVDGQSVDSPRDVSRAVRRKKGGETVEVELVRGRSSRKMTVTLDERKARERAIDLGDLRDEFRGRAWAWKDGDVEVRMPRFKIDNLDALSSLRDRLEALEKRLQALERKLDK